MSVRCAIPLRRFVCVCLAVVLAGMTETFAAPPSPREEASKINELFPRDAGLILVVSDAASQRSSGPGRVLAEGLTSSGWVPEEMIASWNGLAKELGWTGSQAFDQLLGQKVALVARCGEDGSLGWSCDWAILSIVSAQTQARLRERLGPSPRGVSDGLSVLAMEDGRFSLAIGRAGPALDRFGSWGDRAGDGVMLLSPGHGTPLFDRLLPLLRAGSSHAGERDKVTDRKRAVADGPDVFVLYRGSIWPCAGCGFDASRAMMLTLEATDVGWKGRLTTTEDVLGLRSSADGGMGWPTALASRFARSSLFWMVGQFAPDTNTSWFFSSITEPWPEVGQLVPKLTGRAGVAIGRSASTTVDALRSPTGEPAHEGSMWGVLAAEGRGPRDRGGEALEQSWLDAGDRSGAGLAVRLALEPDGSRNNQPATPIELAPAFAAIDRCDVRIVDLDASTTATPWGLDVAANASLAWGSEFGALRSRPWWFISMGTNAAANVAELRRHVPRAEERPARPVLFEGEVWPRKLGLARAGRTNDAAHPIAATSSYFDRVRWECWSVPEAGFGMLEGEFEIWMRGWGEQDEAPQAPASLPRSAFDR